MLCYLLHFVPSVILYAFLLPAFDLAVLPCMATSSRVVIWQLFTFD